MTHEKCSGFFVWFRERQRKKRFECSTHLRIWVSWHINLHSKCHQFKLLQLFDWPNEHIARHSVVILLHWIWWVWHCTLTVQFILTWLAMAKCMLFDALLAIGGNAEHWRASARGRSNNTHTKRHQRHKQKAGRSQDKITRHNLRNYCWKLMNVLFLSWMLETLVAPTTLNAF